MQEHPGRAPNPVIKVHDLAWLEFEKPDLAKAEAFARAFGFEVAARTGSELRLRGTDPGSPCALVRPGAGSRFTAMAFAAADPRDVHRLAQHTGAAVRPLPDSLGGIAVELADPTGLPVRVVAGTHQLGQLRPQEPLPLNFGHDIARINATQRPPRAPARVQRLGHLVLQSTRYRETLDWYLEHLGLIVSDFLFFPGQRERGPDPRQLPAGAKAPCPHPDPGGVGNGMGHDGRPRVRCRHATRIAALLGSGPRAASSAARRSHPAVAELDARTPIAASALTRRHVVPQRSAVRRLYACLHDAVVSRRPRRTDPPWDNSPRGRTPQRAGPVAGHRTSDCRDHPARPRRDAIGGGCHETLPTCAVVSGLGQPPQPRWPSQPPQMPLRQP